MRIYLPVSHVSWPIMTVFASFTLIASCVLPGIADGQTTRMAASEPGLSAATLLQGTPVMLLLDQTVESGHSRIGQRVAFEVSKDVELGNRVVIPAGALALGTVTQASRARLFGRDGRVNVNIDAVELPGGQVVPLSISPDLEDEGRGTRDDAISASLVPPPVAPHLIAVKRRDAVIPEGTEVRAFVRRNTVVVEQTAYVSN